MSVTLARRESRGESGLHKCQHFAKTHLQESWFLMLVRKCEAVVRRHGSQNCAYDWCDI